jgi:hypothetical protein
VEQLRVTQDGAERQALRNSIMKFWVGNIFKELLRPGRANTSGAFSRFPLLTSAPTSTILTTVSRAFPRTLHTNGGLVLQPRPSTSFPIHHPQTTLPLDATQSAIVTASLNKLQIN